jgi:hypothetical protein
MSNLEIPTKRKNQNNLVPNPKPVFEKRTFQINPPLHNSAPIGRRVASDARARHLSPCPICSAGLAISEYIEQTLPLRYALTGHSWS